MSVRTKGRRKIIVGDQTYIWYVTLDDDSPYIILHIVSDDKRLMSSAMLCHGACMSTMKKRTSIGIVQRNPRTDN